MVVSSCFLFDDRFGHRTPAYAEEIDDHSSGSHQRNSVVKVC
jgi:hypothetical protein